MSDDFRIACEFIDFEILFVSLGSKRVDDVRISGMEVFIFFFGGLGIGWEDLLLVWGWVLSINGYG